MQTAFSKQALPARGISRKALAVHAQLKQEVRPAAPTTAAPSSSSADGSAEIYLGFKKGDYAPRAGRKGRVIRDDPSKYPAKEDFGVLTGATGGWAGGEVGLWKIREEVEAAKAQKKADAAAKAAASSLPRPSSPDEDLIYLGYGKSEEDFAARKAGVKGRFIVDKAEKYPGKDNLGPLIGVAGGFAGGEKGLKGFVETGEVRLRSPDDLTGRRQFSPVAVALLLVGAGAGGGLLLNEVADVGEGVVKADLLSAPIDDNTKTLALAAVALLGSAGLVGAGRAAISSFNERMREGATRLVTLAGFWLVLFVAARAVLEL